MAQQAVTPHGLRTRAALLEAGRSLAGEVGLATLSVNAITERAGVAKGTFYVHFTDREALVEALREDFHARAAATIREAAGDREPGAQRLVAGLLGYLDACRHERAIKALLREPRHELSSAGGRDPDHAFAHAVERNLRAMGWREAAAGARLVVAMVGEVAVVELEAGRKDPAARRALRRFVERADMTGERG